MSKFSKIFLRGIGEGAIYGAVWGLISVPFLSFAEIIQREKFKTPTTDPFHEIKDDWKVVGLAVTWPISVPVGMYLVNRDRHD